MAALEKTWISYVDPEIFQNLTVSEDVLLQMNSRAIYRVLSLSVIGSSDELESISGLPLLGWVIDYERISTFIRILKYNISAEMVF